MREHRRRRKENKEKEVKREGERMEDKGRERREC